MIRRRSTEPDRQTVGHYLTRLRRRAMALHLLRALAVGVGAAVCVFAAAALIAGPLGAAWIAGLGWLGVGAALAGAGYFGWRSIRPLRGSGATRLLGALRPELPSLARSAYELGADPPPGASLAMIAAHGDRVREVLSSVPVARVIPLRSLGHRALGYGLVALMLAGAALVSDRGQAGAFAMLHPEARDERGDRVAIAFVDVRARLLFPSYLGREPEEVRDVTDLEVPRGTTVEISARPRIEAEATGLEIGGRAIRMERIEGSRVMARFVAREDARFALYLDPADGERVRDASERNLRVIDDAAPAISLVAPSEDVVLEVPEVVTVSWYVSDDVGVESVDLVVRTPDGEEQRRRVQTYGEGRRPAQTVGSSTVDPRAMALEPGDAVEVWVEARDGDVVNGPNVGRTRTLTITLASEATRREQRLASLRGVLDQALTALADRLESELPEDEEAAGVRTAALATSTVALEEMLRDYAEEAAAAPDARPTDLALYPAMASRLRRLRREEETAHRARRATLERRRAVDERFVTELEDDSLTLDDLLARARVADAAEIARELESVRREIRSLLAELRRTDSAEARRHLLAAIAQAQRRMQELAQRIAQMGTSVPQEFMNSSEMPTRESAEALSQLEEAVQRGDLEAADRLVGELEHQIDAIARALGQTDAQIAEARFGPRERALANAMESLGELEGEQQQLSQRGAERRSRAASRALEALGGRDANIGERMARRTRETRALLEGVDRARLASFEQDAYDRARQRLVDAEDALSAGDLGEAQRMVRAAALDSSALARDLELSSLMFPGREGETSADARQAEQAARRVDQLGRELDEALPDMAGHVSPEDRASMRGEVERQAQALGAAERLARSFSAGPDGSPLDEDAPRELGEAATDMRGAREALAAGDPLESARLAEEAARRVTELRERLENQQQSGGGGGRGGSSDDAEPVVIPDADQFEGPMEMRRRILDAMQEGAPRGYEDAVRRYYEGLLR